MAEVVAVASTPDALKYPGIAKHKPPLHYGVSHVNTDMKGLKWRLFPRRGDVREMGFPWRNRNPHEVWARLVAEVLRLNPRVE